MSTANRGRGKLTDADAKGETADELQIKYRDMEQTRKKETSRRTNQSNIRMQRQQIDKLKKDNERLKEDLALETRQAKQANNMSASAQIAKLQDQGDIFIIKIKREKERIRRLDEQIKLMQNEIIKHKQDMGGINEFRQKNQYVQRNIRILENRLDKALVKFNEALAHNNSLRHQIENLRKERVRFDDLYNTLKRELEAKKKQMDAVIDTAKQAYKARDLAQAEMIKLKEEADRDQKHFELEWEKLGRLIEEDRKNKDFFKEEVGNIKSEKSGGTVRGDLGESAMRMDPALDEAKALRERNRRSNEAINKDVQNIQKSMATVQKHEEAFAKIQKATKITDIDELVNTFINAEDQNFTLFNYVNDLTNEIEKLEESITSIKGEIVKYKGDGQGVDNERKKILSDLESKLQKTEIKAITYENKYGDAMKTVHKLKEGIQGIFDKIGCANIVPPEMLGSAGVTEGSMMLYLGVIEQRTNELLQLYNAQQVKEANAARDNDEDEGEDDAFNGQGKGRDDDEDGGYTDDAAIMDAVNARV